MPQFAFVLLDRLKSASGDDSAYDYACIYAQ